MLYETNIRIQRFKSELAAVAVIVCPRALMIPYVMSTERILAV